jgi:PAT family beta-lactamase induction signal transducer AmpG
MILKYKQSLAIWLSGVISSMSILLSGNSLNFWLAKEGVSTISIGLFSLIALPYAFNFLWAPIIDSVKIKYLQQKFGKRLSWIIVLQIIASMIIFAIGTLNPQNDLYYLSILSLLLSFVTSTQDIALNGLRADILGNSKLGSGSAIHIFGYRIGALIGGSGAIYLSIIMSWNQIYHLFAVLLLSLLFFFIKLIENSDQYNTSNQEEKVQIFSFKEIIFSDYNPRFMVLIMLFLILYRMADNFINVMINPFLLHLQFSDFEIATVSKLFGILTSILGSFIGGMIMSHKKDIYKYLLIFGILHILAHTLFIIQALFVHNLQLLYLVMGTESFTGGMTMTAYIALITQLCHGKYAGTRYSFFSSMMGVSRALFPSISGYIVYKYGWVYFFSFVSLAAIPSLLILIYISRFLGSVKEN